jgi:Arc/MetJ family transcription regulator
MQMRTTLNLDDDLVKAVMKSSGITSKTEAIHKALSEYLAMLNREAIKDAWGKLDFDLDVRALRDREHQELQEYRMR